VPITGSYAASKILAISINQKTNIGGSMATFR